MSCNVVPTQDQDVYKRQEYCGVYLLVAGRNIPMAYPDRRTPLLESYENAAVILSLIHI